MSELTSADHGVSSFRSRLGEWVESTSVQRFVVLVILLNAVVLGLETSPTMMDAAGGVLIGIDTICLAIFVVELALKLFAFGAGFFRSPWNVFDFIVVAVALVPAGAGFDVLRTLRVLRVLRLISALPQLRKVVSALIHAIPGILSTGALLGLVFYVGAVMTTTLFGESMPDYFGNMGDSLFSLFQITTLSSWETLVRPAMDEHPWAWAFFIPFILVAAFTTLNLIIAVIVDAMNTMHDMPSVKSLPGEEEEGPDEEAGKNRADAVPAGTQESAAPVPGVSPGPPGETAGDLEADERAALQQELRALRADVAELSRRLS